MTPGPLLFARYAFRPNELGYCGGEDERALFQYTVEQTVDGGLVQLERQFEGAYPYLQLIARANAIADPWTLAWWKLTGWATSCSNGWI
jgi:hypothetical protein